MHRHDSIPASSNCLIGSKGGFTLIELSIVLVIIGLIIGAILVGQDMIAAATVRMQIAQIEKYQSAVNTFKSKFNNQLPGDISNADAVAFGFSARGAYAGEGDGNGIIEGVTTNLAGHNYGIALAAGETAMFWVDLAQAQLIDISLSTASPSVVPGATVTGSAVALYMPPAKIGGGNYVFVWSGGSSPKLGTAQGLGSVNYYGISAQYTINTSVGLGSNATIPVQQAYAMDSKVDDGFPTSGTVVAGTPNGGFNCLWAIPAFPQGCNIPVISLAGSSTTCFDNNGNNTNTATYSTKWNSGSNPNCTLSFKFQ